MKSEPVNVVIVMRDSEPRFIESPYGDHEIMFIIEDSTFESKWEVAGWIDMERYSDNDNAAVPILMRQDTHDRFWLDVEGPAYLMSRIVPVLNEHALTSLPRSLRLVLASANQPGGTNLTDIRFIDDSLSCLLDWMYQQDLLDKLQELTS